MTKSRRSVDSADAAVGEMSGEILRLNQRVSDMGKYVRSLCPRGLGSSWFDRNFCDLVWVRVLGGS